MISKFLNYTYGYLPVKKLSIFLAGGAVNFVLKITLTIVLTEFAKIPYFTSYIVTLIIIIIYSFYYNAYLTFKVQDNKKANFIKYTLAVISFNFADAALVKFLTEKLGLYYIMSIILITATLLVCKYLIYNSVVFKGNKP